MKKLEQSYTKKGTIQGARTHVAPMQSIAMRDVSQLFTIMTLDLIAAFALLFVEVIYNILSIITK